MTEAAKETITTNSLSFDIHLQESYDQAMETVKKALKEEGFGVLTSIDVRATLKDKLGEDFRSYTILGVCNPPLAFRALSHSAEVGLMLPCNVTVEEDLQGGSTVRIIDPVAMLESAGMAEDPVLKEVAGQARERLQRVAGSLSHRQ